MVKSKSKKKAVKFSDRIASGLQEYGKIADALSNAYYGKEK